MEIGAGPKGDICSKTAQKRASRSVLLGDVLQDSLLHPRCSAAPRKDCFPPFPARNSGGKKSQNKERENPEDSVRSSMPCRARACCPEGWAQTAKKWCWKRHLGERGARSGERQRHGRGCSGTTHARTASSPRLLASVLHVAF